MVRNCEFFLEDFKTLLGCFSIEERVRRISQIKVTHKFVSVLLFFYWTLIRLSHDTVNAVESQKPVIIS